MRGSGWNGSSSSLLVFLFFFLSHLERPQELSEGGKRALETIGALWEKGRADRGQLSGPMDLPSLPCQGGKEIKLHQFDEYLFPKMDLSGREKREVFHGKINTGKEEKKSQIKEQSNL